LRVHLAIYMAGEEWETAGAPEMANLQLINLRSESAVSFGFNVLPLTRPLRNHVNQGRLLWHCGIR
jgi:hypothetical protein